MRDMFQMFVGLQAMGFVIKTGAFPREGDIKNLVDSAETLTKQVLAKQPAIDKLVEDYEQQRFGRPR